MWLQPLWIVSSFNEFLFFRFSNWRGLRSVGLQRKVRSSTSSWIVSLSKRRKCAVSCFMCRTLFGARTSHREISFCKQAWPCCLSLLLLLIALRQVLFMPHGALWTLHLRSRSSLICVLVGIGWCCVVGLPKTQVSAGILVTPLGVRQRQGQGCEYQTSRMQITSRKTHPGLSQCFRSHQMAVIPAPNQFSWHYSAQ